MREEVVLEVVDHRYCLIEELLSTATVHENRLGTEHLGYLSENACTSLSHEPVAELTNERISGDAGESVRATTLQSYAQLTYGHFLTLILLGDIVELTQNLHACLYLVAIYTLGHEEFDAVFIVVTEHSHEVFGLVVFTAETQYKHSSCIWMQTDVAEHLTGVLVVF